MSLEKQKSRFRSLDAWFQTTSGLLVANAFRDEINNIKDLLHGETFLQLGSCGANPWLGAFRYQHKWLASPILHNNNQTFVATLNKLPLDRNSVDCVFLPLTLEAFRTKEDFLDEVDRVLKPMGYVVVIAVNPFSLWSFWLRFSDEGFFGHLRGKAKSVFALKNALLHRNYIQCHVSNFYYVPPLTSLKWIQKLSFLNNVGGMISLIPSGFYCLVMQKYQPEPLLLHTNFLQKSAAVVNNTALCKNWRIHNNRSQK